MAKGAWGRLPLCPVSRRRVCTCPANPATCPGPGNRRGGFPMRDGAAVPSRRCFRPGALRRGDDGDTGAVGGRCGYRAVVRVVLAENHAESGLETKAENRPLVPEDGHVPRGRLLDAAAAGIRSGPNRQQRPAGSLCLLEYSNTSSTSTSLITTPRKRKVTRTAGCTTMLNQHAWTADSLQASRQPTTPGFRCHVPLGA